jgi:lysozyme
MGSAVSAIACELVKKWEGCKLEAYQDGGGVWTIGVGHTGADVAPGNIWTQEQADRRLQADLDNAVDTVRRLVGIPLTANQEAALASFVFNLGETQFAKSTLLRRVNEGNHVEAALEFTKWHHDNGKKVRGLLRRRLDEAALYLA